MHSLCKNGNWPEKSTPPPLVAVVTHASELGIGLCKLFHPAILDGRTWSKLIDHGVLRENMENMENKENTENMKKMKNINQMTLFL